MTTSNKQSTPVTPTAKGRGAEWIAILRQYWGYDSFRGIQLDIINSIASGHDTLGLMPTGGGKSITFQVPTMAMEGLCLVVTPLIALMKDQVQNLRQRGIMAAAIYSGQTRSEVVQHLDNAIFGAYKFLYVSPERLSTEIFMNKVRRMKVCLITVDEAHCISQWGYDFRPHYLRIAEVRKLLPGVPVLALTATATRMVVDDIQQKLAFVDGQVYKMSFARPNLHYIVRPTGDKFAELLHILQCVDGSAIVYTRSRNGTREVADKLNEAGITALHYHAGLTSLDKDTRQQAWQRDQVRVMVATNAFGMGIDKPDVRLVVHKDVPDSLEAYFQEAGRGGRDGQVAYGVLLTDGEDAKRLSMHLTQAFPDRTYIRRVYADLASFFQIAEGEAEGRTFDFNMERFCHVFKHFPVLLVSALNLLTQAGYIHFSLEDENSSRVIFLVRRDELYGIDYLNSAEERVLNIIMRNTCGIFADYVPVDEERLAEKCGMTREQVYNHLRHLTQLRVLNYVPHKDTPQITYTCRRIDADQVQIMPDIYEVRRDQYRTRIDAMIRYFTETDMCRSRFLLHYFDDDGPDCGYCDVCIAREEETASMPQSQQVDEAAHHVMTVVEAGRTYPLAYFKESGFAHGVLLQALARLQHEGKITFDGVNIVVG